MGSTSKPDFPNNLPKLREEPIKLKPAKVNDLKTLLEYIPPVHHKFYEQIFSNSCTNLQKPLRGRPRKHVHGTQTPDPLSDSDETVTDYDVQLDDNNE